MLGYTEYIVKQSERLCKSEYTGTARFLGIRQGALLSSAERNELLFTVDIVSIAHLVLVRLSFTVCRASRATTLCQHRQDDEEDNG